MVIRRLSACRTWPVSHSGGGRLGGVVQALREIARICSHVGAWYTRGVTLVCRVVSPIIGVTWAVIT